MDCGRLGKPYRFGLKIWSKMDFNWKETGSNKRQCLRQISLPRLIKCPLKNQQNMEITLNSKHADLDLETDANLILKSSYLLS